MWYRAALKQHFTNLQLVARDKGRQVDAACDKVIAHHERIYVQGSQHLQTHRRNFSSFYELAPVKGFACMISRKANTLHYAHTLPHPVRPGRWLFYQHSNSTRMPHIQRVDTSQ